MPKRSEDKKIDSITAIKRVAANVIENKTWYGQQKVDPETDKPSTAPNGIKYKTQYGQQKVDPETGKPSTAPNAINYQNWHGQRKVDPETGKPSTAPNAVKYHIWYRQRKVDPKTGKPSTAPNAIKHQTWYNRRKVDPVTGHLSTASNAISYSSWLKQDKNVGETTKFKASLQKSFDKSLIASIITSPPSTQSTTQLIEPLEISSLIFSQHSQQNVTSNINKFPPVAAIIDPKALIESMFLFELQNHVKIYLNSIILLRESYYRLQIQYEKLYEEYSQLIIIYQTRFGLQIENYIFLASVEFQLLPSHETIDQVVSETILKGLQQHLAFQEKECNEFKYKLQQECDRLSIALQNLKNAFKDMTGENADEALSVYRNQQYHFRLA